MKEETMKLATFNNDWYNPGAGKIKRAFWFLINALLFNSSLFPFSKLKTAVLRAFGAKIGLGVVIKPNVNIKYPWNLLIEENVWIGENVWIDNLAKVTIKSNVCISQGALLLCGNHDYKKSTFDLIVKEISIEAGAWIGAKTVICPGIHVGQNAVLTVGSIATQDLKPNFVYQGNPAQVIKERKFEILK